jgi:hypothetical protein
MKIAHARLSIAALLVPFALAGLPACESKSDEGDKKEAKDDKKDDDDKKKDDDKKDDDKKKDDEGDTKPASDSKFTKDQKVEVKWGSTWYKATILEVQGDKYKVHYDGWDAKWDQEVGPAKVREPQGVKYPWKKDDKVEVQWKKEWYAATILEVDGEKFKVHYDGWDAKWDEEVDGNRIRPVQKK